MVKRTIRKFKKALAAAMAVVMVCSNANPLYADMGFVNQSGGGKSDNVVLQDITLELDLTEGLNTGETYMYDMVSVGKEMAYTSEKVTMSNVDMTVSGYVQGKAGPVEEDITQTGIRFTPEYNGTLQVAGQLESGETFQIAQVTEVSAVSGSAVKVVFDYKNDKEEADNILFDKFSVKAGETYYIGAEKSDMKVSMFSYAFRGYFDSGISLTSDARAVKEIETLDLTNGLEVGQTYMDGMICVGTAMTYTKGNTTLSNATDTVEGYVTNGTNPNIQDGTGALIQFTPKKDGTVQVAGQLGAGKKFCRSRK